MPEIMAGWRVRYFSEEGGGVEFQPGLPTGLIQGGHKLS